MKKHSLLLISLVLASASMQAQDVVKVAVGDNQNQGITYTLPKTNIKIEATAVCTQIKAGVYAQYAEKYLGLTDVCLEDQTIWSLSSVEMSPVSVPDASRTFHIVFTEKGQLPTFYLSAEGCLLGVNQEPASVAQADVIETEPVEQKKKLTMFNVMSEELLKAGSKAKQAEIAARQIYRIRESRLNLLTGEVDNLPADGASFQLVLDNLNSQEEAYMELFTGEKTVSEIRRTFTYEVADEDAGTVMFRFSKHYGFIDADDLSGEPYNMTLSLLEDNRMPDAPTVDAKGKKIPAPTGIAYCVPGKARVTLLHKTTVLSQLEVYMGQFGHTERLDRAHFLNKKAPASALFNAATGAVQFYSAE